MLFCRISKFVYCLSLLPLSVYADTKLDVPEAVKERAIAIATTLGGKGSFIKEVSKAADAPGLRQATQVIYTDANGALQNMIMLPDGIHFIAGPIGIYDPSDNSISDINRTKHIVPSESADTNIEPVTASPTQAPPATPAPALPEERFKLDGIFRYSNFTTAGKAVFKDAANATANYFSLLDAAKGVKDGNGGHELYVLFDPQCHFCLLKYEGLRPLIDAGKVTVYWIPVVGPSEPPYTNLLLLTDPNTTNEQKLERLKLFAKKLPLNEEVKPGVESSHWLKRTTSLLAMIRSESSETRSAGTPQMFYKTDDGTIKQQYGYSSNFLRDLKIDLKLD